MLSRSKHSVQKGKLTPTGSGPGEPKETGWVWPWQPWVEEGHRSGPAWVSEQGSSHHGCGPGPESGDPTGAAQFHDGPRSEKRAIGRANLKSSKSSLTLLALWGLPSSLPAAAHHSAYPTVVQLLSYCQKRKLRAITCPLVRCHIPELYLL